MKEGKARETIVGQLKRPARSATCKTLVRSSGGDVSRVEAKESRRDARKARGRGACLAVASIFPTSATCV